MAKQSKTLQNYVMTTGNKKLHLNRPCAPAAYLQAPFGKSGIASPAWREGNRDMKHHEAMNIMNSQKHQKASESIRKHQKAEVKALKCLCCG